mgnify:CR=1 FL=1
MTSLSNIILERTRGSSFCWFSKGPVSRRNSELKQEARLAFESYGIFDMFCLTSRMFYILYSERVSVLTVWYEAYIFS